MPTLTTQEVSEFRATVRGELARIWPSPRAAGEQQADGSALRAVWAAAAAQDWTAIGALEALDAAIVAMRELGRCACPLPLMDVYVAARVLAGQVELEAAILDGSLRPVVAIDRGDASVHAVEGARTATHVLVLPRDGGAEARLCNAGEATPTPGVAIPDWADVALGAEAASATLDERVVEEAKVLLRLGLAVRAMAAAEAAHELAVEHAKTRRAFGKPIGAFQAVSHRVRTPRSTSSPPATS